MIGNIQGHAPLTIHQSTIRMQPCFSGSMTDWNRNESTTGRSKSDEGNLVSLNRHPVVHNTVIPLGEGSH